MKSEKSSESRYIAIQKQCFHAESEKHSGQERVRKVKMPERKQHQSMPMFSMCSMQVALGSGDSNPGG